MSLLKFLQKIFGVKAKAKPMSADEVRQAKMKIIESHFGCQGAARVIANNDRIDKLIQDIESCDVLGQGRALRILGLAETEGNFGLFNSDLISQLTQIDHL